MNAKPHIWLFHAPESGDPYASAFRKAGFMPRSIPVLDIVFLPVDLSDARAVDAVVVTSRRSAEALRQTGRPLPTRALWYAVGPATRTALAELGVPVADETPGTGTELAEALIDAGVRRALYVAGYPHRSELPDTLRAAGVTVDIRTAYRAAIRVPLELTGVTTAAWAVFFSPRGAEAALSVELDWANVSLAAIGPTTAEALRAAGRPVSAIADEPTAESLVEAVLASKSAIS